MSWLSNLFGGGGATASSKPTKTVEYKGFTIDAVPYKDSGQYQLKGMISKMVNGEMKSYSFIRADKFADIETAADIAISKGQLIIDEQGERMFAS
jgi:hypothetical protein